jgi:hypothetical protein
LVKDPEHRIILELASGAPGKGLKVGVDKTDDAPVPDLELDVEGDSLHLVTITKG